MRNARETVQVECRNKPMERMGIRARSNNNLLLKSEEEDEDAKSSGQKGALITTRDRSATVAKFVAEFSEMG